MLHARSVALFAMYYNLGRLQTTPAAAAKITKPVWKLVISLMYSKHGEVEEAA
jgi:hypothetical protein